MSVSRPFQPWSSVKATIVIYRTSEKFDGTISQSENIFGSIHDFRNYLRWEPHVASMIGYPVPPGQTMPVHTTIKAASLSVRYGMSPDALDNETSFQDVQHFASFLKESRPDIAAALQLKF